MDRVTIPDKDGIYKILHVNMNNEDYLRFSELDKENQPYYRNILEDFIKEFDTLPTMVMQTSGRGATKLGDEIRLMEIGSVEFGLADKQKLKYLIEENSHYRVI